MLPCPAAVRGLACGRRRAKRDGFRSTNHRCDGALVFGARRWRRRAPVPIGLRENPK